MGMGRYLRALARSWILVLIFVILGAGVGYAVAHETTAMYRSSVRMVVSGTGDELTVRVLSVQRAQALAQLAPTAPAVQAAATAARYPLAKPHVHASAPEQSPFVDLRVEDSDPNRAQAIANAFATTLPAVLVRYEGPTSSRVVLTNLAPATTPGGAYSPDRLVYLGLGAAAGLVLGLIVASIRFAVDHTVRDSDELERLTGLTVLGTVPRDVPKKLLPAVSDPRSPRAEAYRQIRTTLLNVQSRRGLQTIAVTSASLGEGKTSVATNLAAVFSRAGHRVALVDADLRRPRVAAFYALRQTYGLTEVLSGVVSLEQALVPLDDGRLAILPSGRIPANPSEALGSVAMERVLESLTEEYEYVIIDTPPMLPVTDASVLAPKVDGVILVARMRHTTRDRVRRAHAALQRVNATILGVVPNQSGKGADKDYRYPYSYTPARRKERAGDSGISPRRLAQAAPPPAAPPPVVPPPPTAAPPPAGPPPAPVVGPPPASTSPETADYGPVHYVMPQSVMPQSVPAPATTMYRPPRQQPLNGEAPDVRDPGGRAH